MATLFAVVVGCGDSSTDSNNEPSNHPPETPIIVAPTNHAIDISRTPTLDWACSDPDGNTVHYSVYLRNDSNITDNDVVPGAGDITASSLQITSSLDLGTKYFWQIVASDNNGGQTEGPIWDFTTVAFDSTFVTIPDTSFRRAIVSHLVGVSLDDSLYVSQVDTITELLNIGSSTQAGSYHIESLEGAQNLIALEKLILSSFPSLSDLSPLQGLTSMTSFGVSYCGVSDISPLQNMTEMTWIDLSHNTISSLSALSGMTKVQSLYVSYNNLTTLEDLRPVAALEVLDATSNDITDIGAVSAMSKVYLLLLSDNQISDLDSLMDMDKIVTLDLSTNNITDIGALEYLPGIHYLYLSNNSITNIEPLIDNTGLATSDFLYLDSNPLDDTSINTYIPQLQARGVSVTY